MRLPSRLTSTICGPPFSGSLAEFVGCAALRTIPPRCTEPVFRGWNGSETSYCRNSPVPKQETYRKRSSSERLMSVISGGTALNPLQQRRQACGIGGLGGNLDHFLDCPFAVVAMPEPDRRGEILQRDHHAQQNRTRGVGSCAGRSSSAICCSAPRSSSCRWRRLRRSQTCSLWP